MDIKELVDLCKKGNEQALSLLYKTYSKKMMRICLHYIPDKQIAQDLLHDGFIVIFTSIETLRTPEKLESWMGIIMVHPTFRVMRQSCRAYSLRVKYRSSLNPYALRFITFILLLIPSTFPVET